MEIYAVVCLTLLMVAVGVVTVYFALTLVQLRRTAKSVEELTVHLNKEVDKVDGITQSAADVAGSMGGAMGKFGALLASLVTTLFKTYGIKEKVASRRKKKTGEDEDNDNDD